jgi:hypothetical protein
LVFTILIFLLGFFIAGFLVACFAPMVWRSACRLTQTRLQALVPLTSSQISADHDQYKAQFAIEMCKREHDIYLLQEKLATQQIANAALTETKRKQILKIQDLEQQIERLIAQTAQNQTALP